MRDRARGCHKRGQNLGREEMEGAMLAGGLDSPGSGPRAGSLG